jgi:hypothetical protein
MFDLDNMWEFIGFAPYFITIAFVGTFLLTFTLVKLSQSETLYQRFTTRMDVWRAKQARKIRQSMLADVSSFLRDRREEELSPREQRIYYQMLDSYYGKIERLYGREQEKANESRGYYDE